MPIIVTRGAASIKSFGFGGAGKPLAPTIGTATRQTNGSVNVTFTAPSYNGGATIISYTAVSNPGSVTGTINQSGSGTVNVTGLTLGTSYTFSVFATNIYGNSPSTSASNAVVAATVPGTPTIGTALVVNGTVASVSYTAPASNGGATITSHTAVSTPGGLTGTRSGAGSGSITIGGLNAGTSYRFRVYATNEIGDSTQSGLSNSITPTSWSVGSDTSSIGESTSRTVNFTVYTEGISTGTYYYQMVGSSVTSGDFSSGWNGSFTLSGSLASGTGSFSATATADSTTEGTESFYASVRVGGTNGTEVATSGFVSISDQSTTPVAAGEQLWFGPDSGTWFVPAGVTVISVIAIGGGGISGMNGNGGGGGGGLGYRNNLAVTSGTPYNYQAGQQNQDSWFRCCAFVRGGGGSSGSNSGGFTTGYGAGGAGGGFTGDGGGSGGRGGDGYWTYSGGGGGGAGGYSGAGGDGGRGSAYPSGSPSALVGSSGSGGGGGGGSGGQWNAGGYVLKSGGSGGGVSYNGAGGSGAGGSVCGGTGVGSGGSGGSAGTIYGTGADPSNRMCFSGGRYGGGQGSSGGDGWYTYDPTPNNQIGALRVIWPATGGSSRNFPNP